jgi:hypothetical protein
MNGAVATDPYNASAGTGQAHVVSCADIREMDVIGYDLTALPEPSALNLLGTILMF